MSDADDIISDVLEALAEVGEDIILRQVVVGAYDPATGTSTTTTTDTIRKGYVMDYNLVVYGNDMINNTLVQAGDKRLYLDANGVAPSLNDQAIIGGVTWQIKNIKDANYTGTSVIYDCTIRR